MVKYPNLKIDAADAQNEEEGRAAERNEDEPAGAAAANIPDIPQERNDPRHPRDILKDLEDAEMFQHTRHYASVAALELAGNGGNEADIAAVLNYIQVHGQDPNDEEAEENPILNITSDNPNVVIAAAYFGHTKLLEFAKQNLHAGVDTLRDCRSIQMHLSAIRNLAVRMCERMGVENIENAIVQGHDVHIHPVEGNAANAQINTGN